MLAALKQSLFSKKSNINSIITSNNNNNEKQKLPPHGLCWSPCLSAMSLETNDQHLIKFRSWYRVFVWHWRAIESAGRVYDVENMFQLSNLQYPSWSKQYLFFRNNLPSDELYLNEFHLYDLHLTTWTVRELSSSEYAFSSSQGFTRTRTTACSQP